MRFYTHFAYLFLWLAVISVTADQIVGESGIDGKPQNAQVLNPPQSANAGVASSVGSVSSDQLAAALSHSNAQTIGQLGPESRQSFGNSISSLNGVPATYLSLYSNNGFPSSALTGSISNPNAQTLLASNYGPTGNNGGSLINSLSSYLPSSSISGQNAGSPSASSNGILSMLRSQPQQGQQRRSSLTNRLKNLMNALFWREPSSTPYLASDSSYSFALKQPPMSFQNQFGSNSASFGNLASGSAYRPVVIGTGQSPGNQQAASSSWNSASPASGPQKSYQWQTNASPYWQTGNSASQMNNYQQPGYAASSPLAVYQPQSAALTASSSNVGVSSNNQPIASQSVSNQQINGQSPSNGNLYSNQYQRSANGHGQFKPVSSSSLYSATSTLGVANQPSSGSIAGSSSKPVAASYQL